MQEKIFNELDYLLSEKLTNITESLTEIRSFLDDNKIPLTTMSDNKIAVGDTLIKALANVSGLLSEYREIKDTWQLTTA